jgi:hypothetical protein
LGIFCRRFLFASFKIFNVWLILTNTNNKAHFQTVQADLQAKNCKRACLSATADFAATKKTKYFKSEKNRMTELKNLKPLTDKNAQLVTSGIKHWGLGGYANILPRIKFSVTRQESSPQSPTFHTASRCSP